MVDVLWLIPARSGSKGISDKNIKELGGLPLLAYRIKTALKLSGPENVWCSTDDKKYAEIAEKYGAKIPFIRPKELAQDSSTSSDVVMHAIEFADKQNLSFKYIGLLEPTSPFVYSADITNAVNSLKEDHAADAIVAVKESRPNTIFIQDADQYLNIIAKAIQSQQNVGRQNLKKQITPSGGFYISKWNSFISKKTFYTEKTLAYEVPDECALEIDEPIDWQWAEFLIEKKLIDLTKIF